MIPSVAQFVAELAADLPDVRSETAVGASTWSRGGNLFAVLGADGIEVRMDPAIAAAAARTPDAAPSSRGLDWVRFNPRELDGHAADRLIAWFDLAYRRAAG